MIIDFSVKNFLSFREEQTISFEATNDKTYSDLYITQINKTRLLKFAVIYGANASGKTNILDAIDYLRTIQLNPPKDKSETTKFIPFLLDENSKNDNGYFKISFFIENKKFIYSIKLSEKIIFHEELIYYPSSQPALLFERKFNQEKNISEIIFGEKLELSSDDQIFLTKSTINNSTVIGTFTKSNIHSDLLNELYTWFKNGLMPVIKSDTNLFSWSSKRIKENESCKNFLIEILNKADFNISNLEFEKAEIELTDDEIKKLEKYPISDKAKQELIETRRISPEQVMFIHKIANDHYSLPKSLQSQGTIRYYGLGGVLNKLISENSILLIDELENSLHYELVRHFIKTFLVNSTNSQLIISTHDIGLLEDDLMRRDAIWIAQKTKNGNSEINSVADYKLHKNISIANAYKIGKLGGKPKLGDIYLDNYGKKDEK